MIEVVLVVLLVDEWVLILSGQRTMEHVSDWQSYREQGRP
jgi:hypothetical protein